ncbi:MAG: hypothetical protein GTO02_21715 [Candidatus Dadabacteria bacterium]|nr:hypothetical protein [Candidatus Dadabacteria bacterium]
MNDKESKHFIVYTDMKNGMEKRVWIPKFIIRWAASFFTWFYFRILGD